MSEPSLFRPIGEKLTAGLGERRAGGRRRIAVVLLGAGEPDRPESVRAFLTGLYGQPGALPLPPGLRGLAAYALAARRVAVVTERLFPGRAMAEAPPAAQAQAKALEEALWDEGEVRTFVALRHWQPRSLETALAVKDWAPDELVLLPLFPQFSRLTTGSSLMDWQRAARSAGLELPTRTLCCYPEEPGLIRGMANLTRWALVAAAAHGTPRLLFCARGMPRRSVRAGDPYPDQCRRTAVAVVAALGMPGLEWRLAYTDEDGALGRIPGVLGPSALREVEEAGRDRRPLVLAPLTQLQDDATVRLEVGDRLRRAGETAGSPHVVAVPAVMTDSDAMQGLANLVRDLRAGTPTGAVVPAPGSPRCPGGVKSCPCRP